MRVRSLIVAAAVALMGVVLAAPAQAYPDDATGSPGAVHGDQGR